MTDKNKNMIENKRKKERKKESKQPICWENKNELIKLSCTN
jgi:hypothetical protein